MPADATLIIRRVGLEDLARCVEIFDRAWHSGHAYAPRGIDAATLQAETRGETLLVAERGGSVVGFGSLYEPESFVHHLYVDPDTQGQGVGAALLASLVALARGPAALKCQTKNPRALAFYRRCGWTEGEHGESQHGPWVRMHAPR